MGTCYRSPRILLLLTLLLLGVPAPAPAQTVDDFVPLTYNDGTNSLPYRLFIPRDYDPSQSYPLVVFLHGAGERGTDNRLQLTAQTAPLVFVRPENQLYWPCFMLAPQCPTTSTWATGTVPPNPSPHLRMTVEVVLALAQVFSIDSNRLYITGLSMGGFGSWDAITRWPGLFAAAVPICGGGNESLAYLCTVTPLWTFHGSADTTVPPARSRNMIAAIVEAGGELAFYTEYAGVGHNSWNRAYAEPLLLPWLFLQGWGR